MRAMRPVQTSMRAIVLSLLLGASALGCSNIYIPNTEVEDNSQNRKVIIVHMDPLCRNDLGLPLGLENPPGSTNPPPPTFASLAQLVGDNPAGLGRLLRGRLWRRC